MRLGCAGSLPEVLLQGAVRLRRAGRKLGSMLGVAVSHRMQHGCSSEQAASSPPLQGQGTFCALLRLLCLLCPACSVAVPLSALLYSAGRAMPEWRLRDAAAG